MKSQFLKIAGVKSEKAFYKKFPTEAAFFKAHPEAKKLVNGGEQDKGQLKKLQQLTDFGNPPKAFPGINTPANPFKISAGNIKPFDPNNPYGNPINLPYNPNFKPGQLSVEPVTGFNSLKQPNLYSQMFGNYQSGQDISTGINQTVSQAAGKTGGLKLGPASQYIQPAMSVIEGIASLGSQKDALRQAKQNARLTDIMAKAAMTRPEEDRRRYVRPEDALIEPNQLFPSYGVGTNVLAEDGASIGGNPTEIMNTFAPNTIYTDMGYEPLDDSNKMKAYKKGGKLKKGQSGLYTSLNTGGFGDFMNEGGGDLLNQLTSQIGSGGYGPTAGNKIGGGIGQAAGTLFGGPVGGMIGQALGSTVGGLIDTTGKKIAQYEREAGQNVSNLLGQYVSKGLQGSFGNYMEDGGYVSNDWQPQVIAKFGEYDVDQLLKPDPTMDTLRAGGQVRQNFMFEQDKQYALGGDLKVYRGEAEPISYNPFLPDGGETVMFRGPSHDDGGMPIEYGNSPVEVEGGEPAVKLQDGGTGDTNLNVYGNLMIDRMAAEEIGDPKAKGMKYKNYVAQLSKDEAKANKKVEKAVDFINNNEIKTPFDKLKFASMEANILGSNMKLKDIADKKMNAAAVQNAINDTAEELGLEADALAKGKLTQAKLGATIGKAQGGAELKKKFDATRQQAIKKLQALYPGKKVEVKVASGDRDIITQQGLKGSGASKTDVSIHNLGGAQDFIIYVDGKQVNDPSIYSKTLHAAAKEQGLFHLKSWDPYHITAVQEGTGKSYQDLLKKYPDLKSSNVFKKTLDYLEEGARNNMLTDQELRAYAQLTGKDVSKLKAYSPDYAAEAKAIGNPKYQFTPPVYTPVKVDITTEKPVTPSTTVPTTTLVPTPTAKEKDKFPWMQFANQVIPYLRPSDREALDPSQLIGEMYALANNQVEPVYAQKFQPQLLTPYDISLQDQLNENQATFSSIARQVGDDPSALSALAAQKYAADSKVLGEQMRINQAQRAGVYNQNIATLNQAQATNLGLMAQQAERQAQARSATKATTQEALNSIAAKTAQNKLENRTLQTYENLYNYRFDPRFRAVNMNPLVDFQEMINNASPEQLKSYETLIGEKTKKSTSKEKARNGSIVKALKNL